MNGFYELANGLINKHISDGQYIFATKLDNKDENILYYSQNNIGSTTLLTNKEGNDIGQFLYTPFGEMWVEQASTVDISHITRFFTNQQYDKESGLYYYNARYYDPHLGSFISPDPYRADFNHYTYCKGNPVNFIDPTGLDAIYFLDTNTAANYGHSGVLVGSDRNPQTGSGGWIYYSKDGKDDTNRREYFPTLEKFQESNFSKRYEEAYQVPTTKRQDDDMKNFGDKNYNKPYDIQINSKGEENCADLLKGILEAGKLKIDSPKCFNPLSIGNFIFTSPKKQFDDFVSKNDGKLIKPHIENKQIVPPPTPKTDTTDTNKDSGSGGNNGKDDKDDESTRYSNYYDPSMNY